MKSPVEFFFKFGDYVTKGDPKRKADFEYYLMWIMFLGFLTILISNIHLFITEGNFSYIGWAIVILAILYFQYMTLRQMHQARKLMFKVSEESTQEELNKVDSVEEMMKNDK